jgi:GTP-binding protein
VSAENEDVAEVYTTIRNELGKFDKALLKLEEVVVLSKIDTVDEKTLKEKIKALEKASKKKNIIALSLYKDETVKAFGDALIKMLQPAVTEDATEVPKETV